MPPVTRRVSRAAKQLPVSSASSAAGDHSVADADSDEVQDEDDVDTDKGHDPTNPNDPTGLDDTHNTDIEPQAGDTDADASQSDLEGDPKLRLRDLCKQIRDLARQSRYRDRKRTDQLWCKIEKFYTRAYPRRTRDLTTPAPALASASTSGPALAPVALDGDDHTAAVRSFPLFPPWLFDSIDTEAAKALDDAVCVCYLDRYQDPIPDKEDTRLVYVRVSTLCHLPSPSSLILYFGPWIRNSRRSLEAIVTYVNLRQGQEQDQEQQSPPPPPPKSSRAGPYTSHINTNPSGRRFLEELYLQAVQHLKARVLARKRPLATRDRDLVRGFDGTRQYLVDAKYPFKPDDICAVLRAAQQQMRAEQHTQQRKEPINKGGGTGNQEAHEQQEEYSQEAEHIEAEHIEEGVETKHQEAHEKLRRTRGDEEKTQPSAEATTALAAEQDDAADDDPKSPSPLTGEADVEITVPNITKQRPPPSLSSEGNDEIGRGSPEPPQITASNDILSSSSPGSSPWFQRRQAHQRPGQGLTSDPAAIEEPNPEPGSSPSHPPSPDPELSWSPVRITHHSALNTPADHGRFHASLHAHQGDETPGSQPMDLTAPLQMGDSAVMSCSAPGVPTSPTGNQSIEVDEVSQLARDSSLLNSHITPKIIAELKTGQGMLSDLIVNSCICDIIAPQSRKKLRPKRDLEDAISHRCKLVFVPRHLHWKKHWILFIVDIEKASSQCSDVFVFDSLRNSTLETHRSDVLLLCYHMALDLVAAGVRPPLPPQPQGHVQSKAGSSGGPTDDPQPVPTPVFSFKVRMADNPEFVSFQPAHSLHCGICVIANAHTFSQSPSALARASIGDAGPGESDEGAFEVIDKDLADDCEQDRRFWAAQLEMLLASNDAVKVLLEQRRRQFDSDFAVQVQKRQIRRAHPGTPQANGVGTGELGEVLGQLAGLRKRKRDEDELDLRQKKAKMSRTSLQVMCEAVALLREDR
ncbi:hypothetical protein GGR56DRAFT_678781 [Xylariaceae sp. FL0804]|nr:hypothetical protein GGR56DRAFT_678781 [Xylariaceae sp. FL0804]